MTKRTHTHRGTCQTCGSVQAIDISKGTVAKHGYTTDYGFFNGTCTGSSIAPLEVAKGWTLVICDRLVQYAEEQKERAAKLRSGEIEPRWYLEVTTHGKREKLTVAKASLEAYDVIRQIERAIWDASRNSTAAYNHDIFLKNLIAKRFGQALYPVAKKDPTTVAKAGTKFSAHNKVWTIKREVFDTRSVRGGYVWECTYENRSGQTLTATFSKGVITKYLKKGVQA